MARGITQDRVNQAADALLQRGERPTIEKVRGELGTGSPNTLIRMLEVWWADLAKRLAAQARADLPGIPDSVQRTMMALWSQAVVSSRQEADARLAEQERLAAERVQTAEAQQAESLRMAAQVQRDQQVTAEALANERQRTEELQAALSDALRSLNEAHATAESQRRSGEEERVRLRADLKRSVTTEERWLRELDRAREEAKAVAGENKILRAEGVRKKELHLRLAEQLATEKRDAKQRIFALERQIKARARAVRPQASPHKVAKRAVRKSASTQRR